jgi:hypothetical protein
MMRRFEFFAVVGGVAAMLSVALWNEVVSAHCDTLDGPIVVEARHALETGDVTPVLKWVRQQDEDAIRAVFDLARAVRGEGGKVRELADRHFLETLVRIHRESEGASYTGLKPAGSAPAIFVAADAALDQGDVTDLADELAHAVREAVTTRFEEARERKQHAADNVGKGRAFVEAYVQYMHFVEGIHEFVEHGAPTHHFEDGESEAPADKH